MRAVFNIYVYPYIFPVIFLSLSGSQILTAALNFLNDGNSIIFRNS